MALHFSARSRKHEEVLNHKCGVFFREVLTGSGRGESERETYRDNTMDLVAESK
jgi:hypothetical protein